MTDVQAEAGPSTAAAGAAPATTSKATTIPIRLISRSDSHAIPASKYMVPSDWRRFQLSELINKVLGNEQAVPFDFIVEDELLRTSLGGFTQAKGLTEETILEIEYVESILPPKYLSSFEHEDWVSDVDLSSKGSFLTASYDSNVRIFSSAIGLEHTLSGHTLPVLSACWLHGSTSAASTSAQTRHAASGGMDRVIRVWSVPASGSGEEARNTHSLSLHTAAVSSVRSTPSQVEGRRQLVSAGWDGLVGYWDFALEASSAENGEGEDKDEPEEAAAQNARGKKRRKGANGSAAATAGKVVKVKPVVALPGHTGHVSRAIFGHASSAGARVETAYSFGQDDHTVREWDLGTAAQAGLKSSDKAILDGCHLAQGGASPALLATGNADRSVCVWDMRDATSVIALTLSGHASSVSSVASHPSNAMLLASASFDGSTRIWDVRAPKQALFSVARQQKKGTAQQKVLCVDWDGELVASGGEDGKLELLQSKGM